MDSILAGQIRNASKPKLDFTSTVSARNAVNSKHHHPRCAQTLSSHYQPLYGG